jgi:hypothetical protein
MDGVINNFESTSSVHFAEDNPIWSILKENDSLVLKEFRNFATRKKEHLHSALSQRKLSF